MRHCTHRCLRDEVGDVHKVAAVSINEGLNPSTGLVVLNLHNVSQSHGAVLLGNKLEGRGPFVVLATEGTLGFSNGFFEGERRLRRGHGSCRPRVRNLSYVISDIPGANTYRV